jgi:hypothetical protein
MIWSSSEIKFHFAFNGSGSGGMRAL